MTRFLLALACVPLLVSPARAAWPGVAGAQYRYWSFSNDNDLRDVLAYWAPGPMHVQLEYWDFTNREARDQFRPEDAYRASADKQPEDGFTVEKSHFQRRE